jgi:hypothetical protein
VRTALTIERISFEENTTCMKIERVSLFRASNHGVEERTGPFTAQEILAKKKPRQSAGLNLDQR